jgi:peptidoglycan/LPS O-acetylase OafA/YrhL
LRRFDALESWRGIAACGVALLHFQSSGWVGNLPIVQGAWLFVDFFFVLSGFVIAANYYERLQAGGVSPWQFMLLRVGRLFPLHLFLLALLLAVHPGPLADLIPTALMAHGPLGIATWNGPSWSVSVEMVAYLFFLAVIRWPFAAVAMLVCGAPIVLFTGPNDAALVRCLVGFSAGVICWRIYRTRVWQTGTTGELMATAAIGTLVWFAATRPVYIATPFVFMVCIYIFAAESGLVSKILRRLTWLGVLSYSIYMVHQPLLLIGRDLGMISKARDATMLNFLLVVLAVSALTYWLIEAPGRTYFRRLVAGRPALRGI